ncbi:helix-turn-helix domain-containing protein [Salinibaculum rarum]|uniref:helix-turn-helix domain-containing protein n=1 Tax=Salinibaculum rarum TaxID=3058903 RepID=UPI00265DCF68|nr:helix-turn-helix domain-containing protein [Salinibaculum sp. KK48]
MGKLEGISAARLRDRLDTVESAKAAKRLMVVLAYLDGVSVTTLSDRYDIPPSTLYYWLDRFEERSLEDAIEDQARPGRPTKLDDDDRVAFEETLRNPPQDAGYDADEWTPELAKQYLEEAFDVSYSAGHIRHYFDHLL